MNELFFFHFIFILFFLIFFSLHIAFHVQNFKHDYIVYQASIL